MRNLIPFKVCKRHLFIIILGIIALVQVLFGSVACATQFEPISDEGSYTFPIINNAINIEDIVNLDSLSLIPVLFTDSPSYPYASFSMNVSSGYAPLTVQFHDTSKNVSKWSWVFGDGGTSTQQNPVHTYSEARTYTATLTAGNANGTSLATNTVLVKSLPVLVTLLPEASFRTNTSSGNAPLTVQFNDTSKNATSWRWVFGDKGVTSTQQNPVYTFTKAGTFNVTLVINGNDSIIATTSILAKQLPEVSFRTNASLGNAPLTVQFNDTSKNATGWSWIFGDSGASAEQNPVHTYKAGTFNVTLTARNENGPGLPATTIILAKQLPEASFRTNVTSGNSPLTVQFNNTSKYATSWSWIFGDGGTSTEQNPVYTYSQAGNYTVSFEAINDNGSSSSTASILAKQLPIANFSTNATNGNPPLTIQFNDTSINATSWSWVFGDGGASTEQNPAHTFLKTGNYNVTLTARNENGSSTANTTILAKLLPTADFKANVTKGNAPLYVQFSDLSLNAESRSWDFTSDGTVDSSDLNPIYVYSTIGTYNATLTVRNTNGTALKNTTITVVQATSATTSTSTRSSGGSGGSSGTTKTTSTSKSKSKSSGTSTQSVSLTQNSTDNSTNVTNKTNATNATNVSQNTTDSKKSPGFEMFFGTVSLLAVFLFRRWKSD